MADKFSKKVRSKIMASIRSENTQIEKSVFRALKKADVKFHKHYKKILGSPDVAIPKKKTAVFIDGDFWHGFRFPLWEKRLRSKFWKRKIERNRKRDKIYHARLRTMGWRVMRVWEHEINERPEKAIAKVIGFIK